MKKLLLILMLGLFAFNANALTTPEPDKSDPVEKVVDLQDVTKSDVNVPTTIESVLKLAEIVPLVGQSVSNAFKAEQLALSKLSVNKSVSGEWCKFDPRLWCSGPIRRDPPAVPDIKVVEDKME